MPPSLAPPPTCTPMPFMTLFVRICCALCFLHPALSDASDPASIELRIEAVDEQMRPLAGLKIDGDYIRTTIGERSFGPPKIQRSPIPFTCVTDAAGGCTLNPPVSNYTIYLEDKKTTDGVRVLVKRIEAAEASAPPFDRPFSLGFEMGLPGKYKFPKDHVFRIYREAQNYRVGRYSKMTSEAALAEAFGIKDSAEAIEIEAKLGTQRWSALQGLEQETFAHLIYDKKLGTSKMLIFSNVTNHSKRWFLEKLSRSDLTARAGYVVDGKTISIPARVRTAEETRAGVERQLDFELPEEHLVSILKPHQPGDDREFSYSIHLAGHQPHKLRLPLFELAALRRRAAMIDAARQAAALLKPILPAEMPASRASP